MARERLRKNISLTAEEDACLDAARKADKARSLSAWLVGFGMARWRWHVNRGTIQDTPPAAEAAPKPRKAAKKKPR